MSLNTPTHGRVNCACGGDCPPGACADGEECLPSNFIDPADCEGGCPDGQECLPSDFIDPDDCPGGCDCSGSTQLLAHTTAIANSPSPAVDTTGATLLVAVTRAAGDDGPTDSEGNAWSGIVLGTEAALWYVENPTTSAAHTFDVGTGLGSGVFAAFAGPLTSGVADQSSSQDGPFFTVDTAGSITPTEDHELVIFGWGADSGTDPSEVADPYLIVDTEPGAAFVAYGTGMAWTWQETAAATEPQIVAPFGFVNGSCVVASFRTASCAACAPCPDCPDCPDPEVHGTYVPFSMGPENADDPDTVIMGLSPHSYFLMDGSGALDISGNGHNGLSSIGTVTYGVASLSSKVPANQATALTAGGSIRFTPPQSSLDAAASPWALAMLLQFDAYDSGVGGSGPFSFMSWSGSSPPKMGHFVESDGHLVLWVDSNFADLGSMTRTRNEVFALGGPHAFILNCVAGGGTTPIASLQIEAWLDGVLVATVPSDGSGIDGGTFSIGRLPGGGPFFGAVDLTFSNLALWSRALTVAEIQAVAGALIDDAILATAWVPT